MLRHAGAQGVCAKFSVLDAERFQLQPWQQAVDPDRDVSGPVGALGGETLPLSPFLPFALSLSHFTFYLGFCSRGFRDLGDLCVLGVIDVFSLTAGSAEGILCTGVAGQFSPSLP